MITRMTPVSPQFGKVYLVTQERSKSNHALTEIPEELNNRTKVRLKPFIKNFRFPVELPEKVDLKQTYNFSTDQYTHDKQQVKIPLQKYQPHYNFGDEQFINDPLNQIRYLLKFNPTQTAEKDYSFGAQKAPIAVLPKKINVNSNETLEERLQAVFNKNIDQYSAFDNVPFFVITNEKDSGTFKFKGKEYELTPKGYKQAFKTIQTPVIADTLTSKSEQTNKTFIDNVNTLLTTIKQKATAELKLHFIASNDEKWGLRKPGSRYYN